MTARAWCAYKVKINIYCNDHKVSFVFQDEVDLDHVETGGEARNPVCACTAFYRLVSSHRELYGF